VVSLLTAVALAVLFHPPKQPAATDTAGVAPAH
jgi:hypothetical protein